VPPPCLPQGPPPLPRRRFRRITLLTMLVPLAASASQDRCQDVIRRLGDRLGPGSGTCTGRPDRTTNNPETTPANNSIEGLPAGAFTPQTDRTVIAPDPPNKTPITKAVPGIQINGLIAGDPQG